MNEKQNFKAICSLTTRVMGLEEGSLAYKNRTRKLQASRSIAGFIGLTEENISRKVVAEILDRDRTATYHYVKFHKKNLDKCEIYKDCFTKIYKEYKNIDAKKDIFVNKRQMKNYLIQNNVKESKDSDVILQVKSGEVVCDIHTTYFDFSNQIENINIALTNYHFTINII